MYYVPAAQTAVDSKSSATKLLDAQLEDALGDFMSSPIRPNPAAAAAPAIKDESSINTSTASSTVGAAAVATVVSDERGPSSPASSVTGSDSDADERGGGGGGGVILASSAEKKTTTTTTTTTTKAPTPAPTTTVDVILRELRAIHELELSLTAKCEIQQFGLEQSGIWLGAKIVAVNGVLVRKLEEVCIAS